MGKEVKKNEYIIKMANNAGDIIIDEEAIAVITGLAAMEVDGVASMAGNTTRELISKIGIKTLSKGVKVDVKGDIVKIEATLNLKYGYNIMEVSKKVQDRIKVAVENMTSPLEVAEIHVRVAGIEMPEDTAKKEK